METSLLSLPNLIETIISFPHLLLLATTLIILFIYFSSRTNRIYLLDFHCYNPPNDLRAPISTIMEHYERSDRFDGESLNFLRKLHRRSGIGSEACMPHNMHQFPPDRSFSASLEEVQDVLFTLVQDLLIKKNISPKSIDILAVNCSTFCSAPSISSMIINKFSFRSNVMSFNLTGMGCSAGLLSISLAKDLLKVHNNKLALVLSFETLSNNGYTGKVKSMLLTNTLFRTGGAAILLSNRVQDKSRAKYVLQHIVRANMSSDDQAYQCVFQEEDEDGFDGVSLSKEILEVAGRALRTNMVKLGPLVLPYSEQLQYGWSIICHKIWGPSSHKGVYKPNFKKAFEHFCIHTGGKAVINGVGNNLGLSKEDVEASRMTLYRFGNTSCSSIWYSLCYLEAKGRVKRGDRVWQIGLGSGFKCNSAVWKCISDVDLTVKNAWSDRIHLYPVDVPEMLDA